MVSLIIDLNHILKKLQIYKDYSGFVLENLYSYKTVVTSSGTLSRKRIFM